MGYQIIIKIANTGVGDTGLIPHAFVAISGPGLSQPVTIGYYPQVKSIRGPVTVRNNAYEYNTVTGMTTPHPYDRTITFDVSAQQAMNGLRFAANVANDPGTYQLLGAADKSNILMADGYQCTGFARDVVRAMGIQGLDLYPKANEGVVQRLLQSYPGMLGPEFSFLALNQYQPYRSTPTGEEFAAVAQSIYSGIKKFDPSDRTPTTDVPTANGSNTLDSTVVPPANLDTSSRNSPSYITDTYANDHLAIINAGGTLSDLWVLQKSGANGFADAQEFYAALLVSNPNITDVNKVREGTPIYLPEKLADGSITYHYANSASINNNTATGEYHMVVPNTDGGGQTVYSRVYAGDMDGPNGTLIASYVIKQVSTNAAGAETFNYNGVQQGLGGDILPQSLIRRSDTDGNGSLDQMEQTLYDKNKDVAGTITDTPDGNGGFNRHISTVVDGKTLDVAQHIDASKAAVDKDGDGDFIDAGDATTTGVSIDGLCSALKKIARKSIRTRPRGRFSSKSHAAYAGTLKRRPHQPRPRGLAAQGDGVFAGQRLPGTEALNNTSTNETFGFNWEVNDAPACQTK